MYEQEIRKLLQQLAFVDDVTYYHSLRVGYLLALFTETQAGRQFLKQAWVTHEECIAAGLLHDIGKSSWPRELLFSTDKIKNMDRDTLLLFWAHKVKSPLDSEKQLLDFFQKTGNRYWERIAKGVVAHHENYDGTGYPYGLAGTDIPLLARGLRIFDSYSAGRELRRYQNPMTKKECLDYIKKNLGSRFDRFWGEQIINFLAIIQDYTEIDMWFEKYMNRLTS